MDRHTPEQRRYNMSQVKSKNTKPEKILMKALREKKVYFTHHRADVFGKPDIVFKRKKVAIFVDSDFWHGKAKLPDTNKEFWEKKISRNIERDKEVNETLKNQGWTVLRLTEHVIKKQIDNCIREIMLIIGEASDFNSAEVDNKESEAR